MGLQTISIIVLIYFLLLFAVAFWAIRRRQQGRSLISNAQIYSLSLAVYCTSWTYYGSVGRAATSGIDFLTIYLGPTLICFSWWFLLRKIIRISKEHNIVSIADFIASRYGKSTYLGAIVTVFAVLGIVPYIALQLKAVAYSFNLLCSSHANLSAEFASISLPGHSQIDTSFIVSTLLALFCILFGAMRLDSTERHEGLVAAVAFESIIKLVAFLAVGLFVCYGMFDGFTDIFSRFLLAFPERESLLLISGDNVSGGKWFSMTILSMMAIMFLPRQFHVMVIENSDISHIRQAMWVFPAYMFLLNLFVLPIALAGLLTFHGDTQLADYYVLSLPLQHGQTALAALVFIGGLSAVAGMVMLESVASATMILNNLIMPVLLRFQWQAQNISPLLLNIKRGAIATVIFLGYFYYRTLGETEALVNIGLISFMAATQFAPALLGGLYWHRANHRGAAIGLIAGFVVWFYTLLVPTFVEAGWLSHSLLYDGPYGIEALRPTALFYLNNLDIWSHSLFWTLFFNLGSFLTFSMLGTPSPEESSQAMRFISVATWDSSREKRKRISKAPTIIEFIDLMAKFIGEKQANKAISDYLGDREIDERGSLSEYEVPSLKLFTEKTLAASVGAPAARIIIENYLSARGSKMEDVFDIFGTVSLSRDASREQLSVLYEAANLISSGDELKTILDNILDLLYRQFRFDLCAIRILDEDHQILRVYSFKGIDSEFLSHADREVNLDTCIGTTFVTNKVVLANDSDCADKPVSMAIVRQHNIKSFAHAPITVEGQPIGVLSSYSRFAKGIYTDEFIELYKNVAAQIGIALRNAKQTTQLIAASEHEKELHIAESIQLGLLPKQMPQIHGLDISGICVPAKQVGGDYYDFFLHPKQQLLDMVIADVSGHNIGAALLMASARTFMQAHSQQTKSAPETLKILNHFLFSDLSHAELFITMFYLRYDLKRNALCYANAGHNQPLVYCPQTDSFELLDAEGLILGILEEVEFEERCITLKPGDIIVLYTDGIVEAQNSANELFGLERLKNTIRDHYKNSSQDIIDITMNAARMFQGRRHFQDDVTLIVLKVNTTPHSGHPNE
ncbi:MAG: SpoIIE family protein phosphatase [Desulfuromonadaceae bacterium]|nr:SpoIIE family protein phosphatase [Desulfuromonadaceae bacterium]